MRWTFPLLLAAALLACGVMIFPVRPAAGEPALGAFRLADQPKDGAESKDEPAGPQADGSIVLSAASARIHGFKLKLEKTPKPTLCNWIDAQEYAEWPKACPKAGKYDVELTFACPPNAGGEFAVVAGASRITGHTADTGNWQTFRTVKVGTLSVLNDNTSVALRSTGSINHILMNVRSMKLTPVKDKK